ncbi:MAG: VCBS repeat-containing protein [Planctomycetes bacterium]|nr:VCBS repeat-containing protein [Planctomycetota bacterium]
MSLVRRSLLGWIVVGGSLTAGTASRAGPGAPECVSLPPGSPDCNGNGVSDACDLAPTVLALEAAGALDAGEGPGGVAAADLDGDENLDLAKADAFGDTVSVLRGRGDGTFGPAVRFAAGDYPDALASADLDGDAKADLAAANGLGGGVSLLWNRGDATFGAPSALLPAERVYAVLAADLDADGDQDLAAAHWKPDRGAVTPFVNRGGRTFAPGATLPAGASPFALAAADLDLDGDVDIAVSFARFTCTSGRCDWIGVFLNDGAAELTSAGEHEAPFDPRDLAAADLDGDGRPDLAVAGGFATQVTLLFNEGNGSFGAAAAVPVGGEARSVAAGDLDGDGDADLAAGTRAWRRGASASFFDLLENAGGGRFERVFELVTGARASLDHLIAADLDRDGAPDLAASAGDTGGSRVLLARNVRRAASLDCDSDGVPDECQVAAGAIPDCSESGLPGPCRADCNRNGRSDECDIALGASDDCDDDGVPDECDPPPYFVLGFRAPELAEGDPSGKALFEASTELFSCGLSGPDGAQGWIVYVKAAGGSPVRATTAGTAAAPFPEGARKGGFEKTEIFKSSACGETVVSAVVLSFTENVTLDPSRSPHEILKFSVEAPVPASGLGSCGLEVAQYCGYPLRAGGDGGGADHPVPTLVTYRGDSIEPERRAAAVALGPAAFRRGDVNSDGTVDISDPIRTFMYLFLGASEPRCLDAADSNDDGRADISDGIHTLNDFFREGTGIPAPGPFECGPDPTPDGVPCATQDGCVQE